jgi:Sulfotransferase family
MRELGFAADMRPATSTSGSTDPVRAGLPWPNLFVVGAPKSGTTSLWRWLGEHPEIFMSPVKEPRFFSGSRSLRSVTDRESYLRLFADARSEKLRGEATPSYLARKRVPEAIRAVSPEARIVISLREPVDWTHSAYLRNVEDGIEDRTFLEAVSDDLAHRRAAPDRSPYVRPSLYSRSVERYMRSFGDRVTVLFFENLAADPRGTMRGLYGALGVDAGFADRFDPKPQNQYAVPRNAAIKPLLAGRRLVRGLIPRGLRQGLFNAMMTPAPKPEPDPESVRMLREAYEPDVVALQALLGRRLPQAWERRFPGVRAASATHSPS